MGCKTLAEIRHPFCVRKIKSITKTTEIFGYVETKIPTSYSSLPGSIPSPETGYTD
jgi:hypothetical protein